MRKRWPGFLLRIHLFIRGSRILSNKIETNSKEIPQ